MLWTRSTSRGNPSHHCRTNMFDGRQGSHGNISRVSCYIHNANLSAKTVYLPKYMVVTFACNDPNTSWMHEAMNPTLWTSPNWTTQHFRTKCKCEKVMKPVNGNENPISLQNWGANNFINAIQLPMDCRDQRCKQIRDTRDKDWHTEMKLSEYNSYRT